MPLHKGKRSTPGDEAALGSGHWLGAFEADKTMPNAKASRYFGWYFN
jgi:hypothetical protein